VHKTTEVNWLRWLVSSVYIIFLSLFPCEFQSRKFRHNLETRLYSNKKYCDTFISQFNKLLTFYLFFSFPVKFLLCWRAVRSRPLSVLFCTITSLAIANDTTPANKQLVRHKNKLRMLHAPNIHVSPCRERKKIERFGGIPSTVLLSLIGWGDGCKVSRDC